MLLLPYRPIVASLPPDNAAAYAVRHGPMRTEDVPVLRPWARLWTGQHKAARSSAP